MAVTPYNLVVDLNKKTLLEGLGSLSSADTPAFFKGDTAAFTIRMVRPAGDFDDPTPIADFPAGSSLTLALGVPGEGTIVIAAISASVVDEEFREGSFLVDSTALRTLLGDAASKEAYLELRLTELGPIKTVLAQVACTIFNVVTLDTATPAQVETTAGIAIDLCEAAASLANGAAVTANAAAVSADEATAATLAAIAIIENITWVGDQLSIDGELGPPLTGPTGATGATGPTGPAGVNGANAGLVWVTDADPSTLTVDDSYNGKIILSGRTYPNTLTIEFPSTLADGFQCKVTQVNTAQVNVGYSGGPEKEPFHESMWTAGSPPTITGVFSGGIEKPGRTIEVLSLSAVIYFYGVLV